MFSKSILFASIVMLGMTPLAAQAAGMQAAPAPSPYDGFVSLAVGGESVTDSFSGNATGISLTGAASVEAAFSNMLGFQGDVVLQSRNQTERSASFSNFQGDIAAHGFYREPGQFLVGGFIQAGSDTQVGNGNHFNEAGIERLYGGGEGQLCWGDFTLYGQAALQEGSDGESPLAFGYVADVEARYFLTPNLKLDGHVGLDHLDANSFSDALTKVNVGVGAEYRLDGSPISVFAQYDHVHRLFDNGFAYNIDDNRFLAGVKFNIGADTLEERDHSGASLKPVTFDPLFIVPQD